MAGFLGTRESVVLSAEGGGRCGLLTLASFLCSLLMDASLGGRERVESSLFFRDRETDREVEEEFMDRKNGRMGEASREETAELDDECAVLAACFAMPLAEECSTALGLTRSPSLA